MENDPRTREKGESLKAFILFILISTSNLLAQVSVPPKSAAELLEESKSVNWEDAVTESVIIEAPVGETWNYASNSLEAVNWSIYFDHISPLESPALDGQVGSLRRCYRNKDESGYAWDEVIINVETQKLRQLVTYNFINYPFTWIHSGEYVFVRQLYESLGPHQSKLTFQTISRPDGNPLFKFLFWVSRKKTAEIFLKNLENIKAAIEHQPRKYPWLPD
jgi:hypothetical protein